MPAGDAPQNGGGGDANLLDDLGFPLPGALTAQQLAERRASSQAAASISGDWAKASSRHALPQPAKLKRMLRKGGVPPALRSWCWPEMSGAAALRTKHPEGHYQDLLAAAAQECVCQRQIELDLPRTFPYHPWLQLPEGQAELRHVLCAFSLHNTKVGYCQGLNFVAALFLLATGREGERAFWLLAALVGHVLAPNTYASNLAGCHSEMRTLAVLLSRRMPRLHRHLESLGCDVSIVATDWFLCLFTTSLPPEVAARVWDVLLNEGSKVLFRVSLAILRLYEPMLLQKDNSGELMHALKTATGKLWSAKLLLHTAFKEIGSLSRAELNKIRQEQQRLVGEMLRAREEARLKQDEEWAARQPRTPDPGPNGQQGEAQGSGSAHQQGSSEPRPLPGYRASTLSHRLKQKGTVSLEGGRVELEELEKSWR